MIRLKLSVKIKSITGINSTFPQRERASVRACVRVCVCVCVYSYIVVIISTNNRYRKHKSNILISKIYSCIVLINSTNNRYRREKNKEKNNTLILKCVRAGYS